ncbi:MAG: sodium-dependent transporter [Clostridia bacterium]|nr:sodium-dependent transporter [Clostridia bacterium]
MKRESFGSRIGFILVSAGCAIGIGNVWKFPYMVGQNGGGLFVLLYMLFLVILGIPVLTMELAVGRAGRGSPVKAYRVLEPEGSHWHVFGHVALLGNYLLMMYYTTVAGWMVAYCIKFLTGAFDTIAMEDTGTVFGELLASPAQMTGYMVIIVLLGFLVCLGGVRQGLERVTMVMMILLLALILVLAAHSLTLPGASGGMAFYLVPDIEKARIAGFGRVITSAMNQAFFTLSIGIGAMAIFGSYMSKEFPLTGEAIQICALDTLVAVVSGVIIFPACFSYGVEPDKGPSLIFITLPRVFIGMSGGRIWGTLFFLFMTFASFSTVTGVFEGLISGLMDNFGFTRKKSVLINMVVVLIGSLPCALGYNILSGVHLIGQRNILDSEDFIVSNLLLPLGSLVYLLFCTTRWGWGAEKYLDECNQGRGIKMARKLIPFFRYVIPILVLIILIQGLIPAE